MQPFTGIAIFYQNLPNTKTYAILVKTNEFTENELHMTASIPVSTLEKFTTFGDLLRFLRRRMEGRGLVVRVHLCSFRRALFPLPCSLRAPGAMVADGPFPNLSPSFLSWWHGADGPDADPADKLTGGVRQTE